MWAFIKKEFYHIFRDYRSMVILFGMPIVQVLLFGFAITTDLKDAKIAILDRSKDVVTRELTQKIISSNYFLLVETLENDKQIKPAFQKGDIKQVIVFEPDFARRLEKEGNAVFS